MIFLLTSTFPFGKGEEFIDQEINYHSPESLTLVVESYDKKTKPRLQIKHPITGNHLSIKNNRFLLAVKILGSLFNVEFYKEIVRYPKLLLSIRCTKSLLLFLFFSKLTEKYLNKLLESSNDKTNIIYTYWFNWSTHAATRLKRKYPSLKVVTRVHGGDLYKERSYKGYTPLNKNYWFSIDKIYSISEHGRQHLINEFKILPSKIDIARLGVTPKGANLTNVSHNSDVLRLLSVAHISSVKRIHLIADSVKYLQNKLDLNVQWTHIGDGSELERLKMHCKTNKINAKFTGLLSPDSVDKYYQQNPVDLLVCASSSEGIPVSMMEALSYGIPIVSTNVGGISELVNDDTGTLIGKEFTAAQMAEAIVTTHNKKLKGSVKLMHFFNSQFNAENNFQQFTSSLADWN